MSQTIEETRPAPTAASTPAVTGTHTTDRPIPMWPEGVIAVCAGITLLVIGLRHRVYLQRKAQELQRAVEEFQRQGGVDDLAQVARQASDFLKSAAG